MNFYQDVFFRSLDILRGRRTIERLHALRESQSWPAQKLAAWQLERLNALLAQAREKSPYYREVLAGVRLPLAGLEELASIPVITKQAMRENFARIPCEGFPENRRVLNRTGGSTGEPTFYYWDKSGMDWNRGSVYRAAEWAGVALGERTVQMSGSHFDFTQVDNLKSRITLWLQRYRDYSVAFLTDAKLEGYFRGVQEWKPTSIWGYASGLHAFSGYVKARHPQARFDFVRAVCTSSETLRPEQRRDIEAVFGAGKVFDQYGSREMYMGSECRLHDGYHLHADVVLTEVVDRDNRPCAPGATGRVIVTDLANHAFPFIRYEIGDVGAMAPAAPCPCGVTLPRLARVEGRIADLVVLRDRVLTPPNFTIIFSDKRGIKAYQIRQDSMDRLDVLVVPDTDYTEEVERYVTGSIREMAGAGVTVDLRRVDDIPVPESGKRRYIVSSVSKEWV
jgi:phenylacetate-CoA ligase